MLLWGLSKVVTVTSILRTSVTFAALECLVTALLNEGAVEGVSFIPKQPETPPSSRG
jgi:hypothetical protein